MEKFISFIKNRNLKKGKNSARFAFLFLALVFGLIIPWRNSTLTEKIVLIGSIWIYLFFVLLYATDERMKNLYKKNRFYGWTQYGISLLFLYLIYRLQFQGFNWMMFTVLPVSAVWQTVLWILGIKRNIAIGNYNYDSKPKLGINVYSIIQVLSHIVVIALINIICIVNGQRESVVFALLNILYFLHCLFYLGLTFIYQNYLIKKYDLFYVLENLS